ncbi:hypothetical protein PIB30_094740, partial [Stylosanthes scabra]|nr:hypothetical protein [Stylosanthes scabra]
GEREEEDGAEEETRWLVVRLRLSGVRRPGGFDGGGGFEVVMEKSGGGCPKAGRLGGGREGGFDGGSGFGCEAVVIRMLEGDDGGRRLSLSKVVVLVARRWTVDDGDD